MDDFQGTGIEFNTGWQERFHARASAGLPAAGKLFQRLRKNPPVKLDSIMQQLHEEAFQMIDCLQCAHCCSTVGPLLIDRDIERMSQASRMKPSEFTERLLRIDGDGDYVFQKMPCPFLGADHYCSIYDNRPRACREYPHTNRRRFHQLLKLTLKNYEVCPAVFWMVEKLKLVKF